MINKSPLLLGFLLGVMALFTGTPAQAQTTTDEPGISDPFEGYNRAIFAFNDALDQHILLPIVDGYRYVVPKPARTGVHNVLSNLRSPITIGNQLLQGDLGGAGDATLRMIVNTVIGVGGLFDVATPNGLPDEPEDFGQTLAVWGVGDGPYMVVPLMPAGSLRDYAGSLVDMYADPVRLWLMNTDREGYYYTRLGLGIIDTRDQFKDALADLRKNSIDYYATMRSATYQRRAAMIADNGNGDVGASADIPNYAAGEQ